MNRRELFLQAYTLVRRNKSLWTAALIGLSSSVIFSPFPVNVVLLVTGNDVAVIAAVFIGFVAAAFMSGVSISLVNSIVDNKPVSLIDGLRAGWPRLMPLATINLILMLPVWIVLVFTTGSVASIFISGLGRPDTLQATTLLNIAGLMFTPFGVSIAINLIGAVIGVGAERAIVLEDMSIVTALPRSVKLLRRKVSDYLSIALVLFGAGLAISLLFALLIEPLLVTLVSPQIAAAPASGGSIDYAAYYLSPAYAVITLTGLVVSSLFAAYASSVWTLAFRQWQSAEE